MSRFRNTAWCVRDFFRRDAVLAIACVLAVASCVAVPPDAQYAAYIDWRTLGLLFSLMVATSGLARAKVLSRMCRALVGACGSGGMLVAALTALAFFTSMVVTNDVALVAFVPLALAALREAGMVRRLPFAIVCMTIAANMGSMLTPIGNPQNIYLLSASGMEPGQLVATMAPYSVAAAALLAATIGVAKLRERKRAEHATPLAAATPNAINNEPEKAAPSNFLTASTLQSASEAPITGATPKRTGGFIKDVSLSSSRTFKTMQTAGTLPKSTSSRASKASPRTAGAHTAAATQSSNTTPNAPQAQTPVALRDILPWVAIIAVCLLCVARIAPVGVAVAVALALALAFDRRALRQVDYALLLTFAAFFVFVGNIGRIEALQQAIAAAVGGHALLVGAAASQVISNVPAAIMLSGFTSDWSALLVGVNIGGLGTLIASMASLISYRQIAVAYPQLKGRYLRLFLVMNFAFLAGLLVLAFAIGILTNCSPAFL
jgi:Na+/H+ antiporter NhaD/arsenite permease-like protein